MSKTDEIEIRDTIATEIVRWIGEPPCAYHWEPDTPGACPHADRCAAGLACADFQHWVSVGSRWKIEKGPQRTRTQIFRYREDIPRIPSASTYVRVFED